MSDDGDKCTLNDGYLTRFRFPEYWAAFCGPFFLSRDLGKERGEQLVFALEDVFHLFHGHRLRAACLNQDFGAIRRGLL